MVATCLFSAKSAHPVPHAQTRSERTRHAYKKPDSGPAAAALVKPACINSLAVADGEGEPPVKRVAACDLHEAIAYMRKWHPGLDILRVELVALIEMVSGSPLN